MNINLHIFKKKLNDVEFDQDENVKIRQVVIYKENIYLNFAYPKGHPEKNRNILKFDKNGKFVWRVQAMDFPEPDRDRPFTYIGIEDGKLYAYNPIGYNCYIDMETGEVYVPPGQRPW